MPIDLLTSVRGRVRPAAYRGLGRFVRPHWVPLGAATALAVIQTMLALAAPWPLKLAVDHAIGVQPLPSWLAPIGPSSPFGIALLAAAAGVALVALGGVIRYVGTYLSGAASERIGAAMRSAVFEQLLRLSLRFHDCHRSGDLVSRILSDVPRVQDALVASFHSVIPNALSLIGMLVVLLAIDAGLALAALTVIPLLALQIMLSRTRIKAAEREVRDRHGGLAAQATEVLRHVRAVQAFAREDEENRRFRTDIAAATHAAVTALAVQARYSPFADLILAAGGGLILVLGVTKVLAGEITVGVLLVILTYLSSLYDPIRSLTRLSSVLAKASASGERLQEVLAADDMVRETPLARPAPAGVCSLGLDRVTFGYHPNVPVLHELSLEIVAGETLCIVGPTGAGKSTLLSLLLRLYDPVEGRVEMAGCDLRQFTLRSVRSRIAVVPQDAWILDGTIGDNIRFGHSLASDEEQYLLGNSIPLGLVQLFDLNRERNLTTWYASIQLAFAALLLVDAACAARLRGGRHSYRLLALAFGFCYLSVDEYISLHERLIPVMQVIVGAALALSAALCCAGWLGDLPANIRHRVLLAGGLYVGGALGMDVASAIIRQFGAGLVYAMATTVEEGLELVGVALFIAALLDLMSENPNWGQDTKLL